MGFLTVQPVFSCSWCSFGEGASLTSLEALMQTQPALALPQSGLAPKPDSRCAKCIPSLCMKPLLFPLTCSRAVPGAPCSCQEHTTSLILLIITIHTQMDGQMDTHMMEFCLKSTPLLSHPCFLHSQFISISIPSPGGKVKAGRAMSKEHFLLLNKENPHYSTTVRFSCQAHFCSLCSSYWDHIFKFLEKGITNPSSS